MTTDDKFLNLSSVDAQNNKKEHERLICVQLNMLFKVFKKKSGDKKKKGAIAPIAPVSAEEVAPQQKKLQQNIDKVVREGGAQLDLRSLSLDNVPPEVWVIQKLSALYLNDNKLTGFPKELGLLVNLATLMANDNTITSIPAEIGALHKLTTLVLSRNNLSVLPPEIGQLRILECLDANKNSLGSLPAEILNLTGLTTLQVEENEIDSLPCTPDGQSLESLPNLKVLNLAKNEFTSIPSCIFEMNKLESFIFCENPVQNLDNFGDRLGQLKALQTLKLSNLGIISMPSALSILSGLVHIDLSCNKLCHFPIEIFDLAHLIVLKMNNNSLPSVPAEIGSLKCLEGIFLQHNSIQQLPYEILLLEGLDRLELAGNPMQNPPLEICQDGIDAILDHMESTAPDTE